MKRIMDFFLSLKTAFGLFILIVALMFVGSLSLPGNLAFFSGIDDTPLFAWLKEAGKPVLTWWIYLMVFSLAFLAASTVFCTAEAVLKKNGGKQILVKLSPQIMHLGVLFIMLGHLLTASIGYKSDITVIKGRSGSIRNGIEVRVSDISVSTDENGYYTDWTALVEILKDGKETGKGTVGPLRPFYHGSMGLYLKSVDMGEDAAALFRVTHDPGAPWALLGGLLLSAGGVVFAFGRLKGG